MAKMGINMIEMYCDMIKERFKPVINQISARDMVFQEKCKTQAKKDLGIYDKVTRLARLKLEIAELKSELKAYTEEYYENGRRMQPKVDQLTQEYMKASSNGFQEKVYSEMNDMIYKIKLSGLDGETKQVFEKLPEVIRKITDEMKTLPEPPKRIKK